MNPLVGELAALVCKTGVGLGGLTRPQRELALEVPALVLAESQVVSEAEVNARLKQALSAQAAFIDTDHVELRRWLVDTGWWTRDAYGKAYVRTTDAQLPPALLELKQALAGLDLPSWVSAQREAQQRLRQARRDAWSQKQDGAAHG
jgi:hypothetical protein